MLILSRREGESIMIGDDVKVTILSAGEKQVKIGIDAPASIAVHREEVYKEIESKKALDGDDESIISSEHS